MLGGQSETELIGGSTKLGPASFFNYVFNFDSDNKAILLNMFQYIIIALIPVVLVLKFVKEYIPEDDDKKDNLELILEIFLQLGVLFVAIYFIDKITRYFPTYSKVPYSKFNEVSFIIPTLLLMFTMQTKLGAKINIIYNRVLQFWNGSKAQYSNANGNGNGNGTAVVNVNGQNIRIRQPIVTNNMHQMSRADTLDNTLIAPQINQMPNNNVSMIDSLPNMMNASGPNNYQAQAMQTAFMDSMEPMAANGALGGIFGSTF
jgi:hypothetical protein